MRLEHDLIEPYAAGLPERAPDLPPELELARPRDPPETRAAWALTLNAINFGSGWWPTIRRRPGRSGFFTVALGLRERFDRDGPWSAAELAQLSPEEIAPVLGQDPAHELMVLFAAALRDLGTRLEGDHGGRFLGPVEAAGGSAVALVEQLATWSCFADTDAYGELRVPFLKRAQLAAADLSGAGMVVCPDLDRLTLFADNLIPHVLRVDGVLAYDPELLARIERGELLEHGSPEEVEIRACAVHAVELLSASRRALAPHEIDLILWTRGRDPRYKAEPRHRSRSTAY